ncbi:MAG TPA: hypothetical protein VL181_01925 [Holophagaceae bacterium]|nr:hypothetical protein [Holophagaceae bacterium]
MRLVACLLSAALLPSTASGQVPQVGQGPRALPWQTGTAPTWQPLEAAPASGPAQVAAPASGPLSARITADGTLEVWNGADVRTVRMGLPGRPKKVWRDGGSPVAVSGRLGFPAKDPLSAGLGGLDWAAADFRASLSGLVWILEDGERVLTIVHPATAQAVYLPLPRGEDFDLVFESTRLVLTAKQGPAGHPMAWAMPWLALLPQFARLGPPATPPASGTALKPFTTGQ